MSVLIGAVDSAVSNKDKGASLESLCEYLFGLLKGVEVTGRNVLLPSEELDLVLWNAQVEEELRPFDSVILVECKNWTRKVDAPTLNAFTSKVRVRSLKTGILIAANGVTGDYDTGQSVGGRHVIAQALRDGVRVITITLDDLRELTSVDDFKSLIKRRFCGIFVGKLLN